MEKKENFFERNRDAIGIGLCVIGITFLGLGMFMLMVGDEENEKRDGKKEQKKEKKDPVEKKEGRK